MDTPDLKRLTVEELEALVVAVMPKARRTHEDYYGAIFYRIVNGEKIFSLERTPIEAWQAAAGELGLH